MIALLRQRIMELGVDAAVADVIYYTLMLLVVGVVSIIANAVAKRLFVRAIERLIKKTSFTWDDVLIERHVFWRLSHIAPALVIYFSAALFGALGPWLQQFALAYMLVMILLVVDAFLNAIVDIYRTFEISKRQPIKGYVQVFKILLYTFGAIFIIATLTDRSPWAFIGSMGALTAILLLVFKDSLLGLMAGIQLTANKMVQVGDWIEMPKYGADGDVVEISLHTVKVQNWDKTISSIPAYALISESFKNWRGMSESGGRRIKRAFYIDMNTITFLDDDALSRYEKFTVLRPYIREKRKEIEDWNRQHTTDWSEVINRRRLTNIGTFRAYIILYLRNHPDILNDMTFLVRHLPPGANGLPMEIYVFSGDTRWAEYENIQADIFDHMLAVVPEFGLRVFQNPSGRDFQALGSR